MSKSRALTPVDVASVTNIAFQVCLNVRWAFARGHFVIVATATRTRDLIVIHYINRLPGVGTLMAGLAFLAGFDMASTLTGGFGAVMARNAVIRNTVMIKPPFNLPSNAFNVVAIRASLAGGNMLRRFTRCNHVVMAPSTLRRCTLKNTAQMTLRARHRCMRTEQWKAGLKVIERVRFGFTPTHTGAKEQHTHHAETSKGQETRNWPHRNSHSQCARDAPKEVRA